MPAASPSATILAIFRERLACIDRDAHGLRIGSLVAHRHECQRAADEFGRSVKLRREGNIVAGAGQPLHQLERIGLDGLFGQPPSMERLEITSDLQRRLPIFDSNQ
jgi:hypothetical protein